MSYPPPPGYGQPGGYPPPGGYGGYAFDAIRGA